MFRTKELTNLTNASYGSANDETTILATAIENTKGVIIHLCSYTIVSNDFGGLVVDGNKTTPEHNTSQNLNGILRDVFIPEGVEVKLVSEGVDRATWAWYEVLS
jgi:hypothetical protein